MGTEETANGEGRLGVMQAEQPPSNFYTLLCLIGENPDFAHDNRDLLRHAQELGSRSYHLLVDIGQKPECPYALMSNEVRMVLALHDPTTHIESLDEPNRTLAYLLKGDPEISFDDKCRGYFASFIYQMNRVYLRWRDGLEHEKQRYWDHFFSMNGNRMQIE